MANRTKVQDEGEVLRWMMEGRTYQWMREEYLRKYDVETSLSMWVGIRRKHGLDRRLVRDESLIPWAVLEEHRHAHPITMLRSIARQRAGKAVSAHMRDLAAGWVRGMERAGTVLHYEPETEAGWTYVPRRPGIDRDLIREPDPRAVLRTRRNRD